MKVKLDENLGARSAALFRQAGHDVATIAEQDLCGAADGDLISVCQKEGRCLVTLDLDFGNPILFRPSDYAGIAVLRLPSRLSASGFYETMQTLIDGLGQASIAGKLWIIQRGRIREYQPKSEESPE